MKLKKFNSGPKLDYISNNSDNQNNQVNYHYKGGSKEELEKNKEKKIDENIYNLLISNDSKNEEKVSSFHKPVIYSERHDNVNKRIEKNPNQVNQLHFGIDEGAKKGKFKIGFNKQKPNYDSNKKNAEAFFIDFPKNEKKIIKVKHKIVASNKDKSDIDK